MSELRVLNAEQVGRLLDPVELGRELTGAMIALSNGLTDAPPRTGTDSGSGTLLTMTGHIPDVGLAAKLVTVFPDSPGADSHRHQGMIVLFDLATGAPRAVLDSEVIGRTRTAVMTAIATDRLARVDAETLTIVGGGPQAVSHARALATLRPWTEVRAVNRSQPAAVVVAGAARDAGADRAVAVDDFRTAVAGADVIALCTHADRAVIDPAWVGPGTHVSSIGSRAELPTELARPGSVVVEWRAAVATAPPAGAADLQHLRPADVIELGEVLAGRSKGRTGRDQITVYKSTGHAVQDVAAAALVVRTAEAEGIGVVVPLAEAG